MNRTVLVVDADVNARMTASDHTRRSPASSGVQPQDIALLRLLHPKRYKVFL